MRTETQARTGMQIAIPSQYETRATVERARQLRAETLGRMLSSAWALLARQRWSTPTVAMTHAGP